jgi:hypothetical protein
MKPSSEDRDQSHANWMASMNEAHSTCRQVLMQASVDVSDPERALWPAVPRRQMTQEHQTVAQCHAAVLDYAQHIRPFRNRCSNKWTERIEQPHEFPEGDTLPVVLSELEQWADRRYKLKVGARHELTGRQEKTEYRRVHLPPAYARKCFIQIDECRERLKLAVDLENHTFDTENDDPGLTHGR